MRKLGIIIAILSVCLLLAGCRLRDRQAVPTSAPEEPTAIPEQPVAAAEQPAASPQSALILFADDFQDGQLEGWQSNGNWMINQNGDVYTLGSQGAGAAWVPGGNTWTDYALRANVRHEGGVLSINYRLTPEGRYFVNLRETGIFLAKEQPAGTIKTLVQNDPPELGAWHYIVIAGEGGLIQVYVDSQLVLSYTDPTPLIGGTIGFGTLAGSRVEVDDLIANLLKDHLPQGSAGWAPSADQPELESAGPVLDDVPSADAESLPLPDAPQTEDDESVQADAADDPVDDPGPEPIAGGVDLHLSGVSIQAGGARVVGHQLSIGVNLRNNGSAAAGAFTVHWYPMDDGVVGCAWDVGTLAPGETTNLSCVYSGYPVAGNFQWGAALDVENETGDTNPNNNRRSGNITIRPADAAPDEDDDSGDIVLFNPPPAPVNCRVGNIGSTSIFVAWDVTGMSDHEGFRVYRSELNLVSTVGETFRGESVGNLQPNTQYHIDVRSYRGNQESAPNECAVDAKTKP